MLSSAAGQQFVPRQSRPCEPKKQALSVEKTAVFGYCGMASGTVSGNCGKSATDQRRVNY